MAPEEIRSRALALPPAERQALVEALWRSLEVDSVALPAWQRNVLDKRLAKLEARPEEGAGWEDVERRVWRGDGAS